MHFTCHTCGQSFIGKDRVPKPKYCGRQCWPSHSLPHDRKVPDLQNCTRCGQQFSRAARGGSRAEFCSTECLRHHQAEQSKARRNAVATAIHCRECGCIIRQGQWCDEHQKQRTKQCLHCNADFIGSPDIRYCSDECRWAKRATRAAPKCTQLEWTQCICGTWVAKRGRTYCSKVCGREANAIKNGWRNRKCPDCGQHLGHLSLKTYCEICAQVRAKQSAKRSRRLTRHSRKHKERAIFYGVQYEYVNPRKVYARDGWRCGICRRKVDKRLKYPHPMSASLDHIIALAERIWEYGHTYKNTQCAHLRCNVLKSNRSAGDQLALIG